MRPICQCLALRLNLIWKRGTFVKATGLGQDLGATSGNNMEWKKERVEKILEVFPEVLSLAGYRFSHSITKWPVHCSLLAEMDECKRFPNHLLCYSYTCWEESARRHFIFYLLVFRVGTQTLSKKEKLLVL